MATYTTRFNLAKPAGTDTADITVINGNMDTIDGAIPAVIDNLTSTSTTSALSANQGKVLQDGKENALTSIVSVDASKILALTDAGKLQICTHATTAINLTVPPNGDVAFPIGTVIPIKQNGAAAVAVVAGSGVTINPSTKLKINAQYESAVLVKEATDTWGFIGSIKA